MDRTKLVQTLKTGSLAGVTIPVGDPFEAVLRPLVTAAGKINREDVRVLTEWRNRFVRSFLTEFQATEERTKKWLTQVVGPDPTRILFMLDDVHGRTIGYLGLAFIDWEQRTGEADAIVRGVETQPGVMTKALLALLRWAHHELGLTKALTVRVRSDNPAVDFYLKLGAETRRVPLRAIEEPGMTRWVEADSLNNNTATELVYITFHPHLYE